MGMRGNHEWFLVAIPYVFHVCAKCEGRSVLRIAEKGGIEPLIALLRDGSAEGKTQAAGALAILAVNNADNQKSIAREGGIEALIGLLRDGSAKDKAWAEGALRSLAYNNSDNKISIARERPLIQTAYNEESDTKAKKEIKYLLDIIETR